MAGIFFNRQWGQTYMNMPCQIGKHHWGQTYTFDKMWIIDRMANLGKIWLEYSLTDSGSRPT